MSRKSKKLDILTGLKERFDALKPGKDSLLTIIEDVELAESVYNSNAIENSTLSLPSMRRMRTRPTGRLCTATARHRRWWRF